MPGGGSKPGERRGGRNKGAPNRRNIERRLIANNVASMIQQANGIASLSTATTEGDARKAEREIIAAQKRQIPLGKDALTMFLGIFMSRASHYNSKGLEPDPTDNTGKTFKDKNPHANEAKFEKWARLAVETAKAVAPYQSPTFRAIMMAPPPAEGAAKRRFTLTIHDARNGQTIVASTNAEEERNAAIIDAVAEDKEDGSA